jgi:exodeoxyribonuclease V gamma subunit
MGFHLIHGNDSEALLEQLAARLRAPAPGQSLLAPEVVLVPQFGLRRWLEIRLVERLGIVANVDFYAPAEYAWRLLRAADPALAAKSGYERELLRWRIFSLLAPLAREPAYPELAAALADGDAGTRLSFADALAHAYERDLAYRSDRLARWERGAEADEWRAELWRRLVHASTQPHRARALADWLRRTASAPPPGLPARLSAFACADISPDLLGFYGKIAQHCRLDFYLPTPCRQYWGDIRSEREQLRDSDRLGDAAAFDSDAFADGENPALAAWGRAGRDLIDRLYSYELVQPEEEQDVSREPRGDSLLAHVQRDVLDRRAPSPAMVKRDGSIQFHRCHSRLREVQALHDRLLDLFAKNPQLTPRDVAVMSPEIGAYAPHIDSVFGGIAREDRRYLPYALSDCPLSSTHALIGVALRLFALPASRFELAEISEWLTLPAVQRRFGFDADDALRLCAWLHAAGVRWGLDAAQHAAVGAGDYVEFSWRFGLERLLLGYASGDLGEADAALIAGVAPDAAVEGTGARLLGAVLRIVDILAALVRAQRREHAPRQWQKIYNEALSQLFDTGAERDETQALERVRSALADFAEETAQAEMTTALDWRCVRDELSARLAEPERGYRFFGGGITVCGMVPLRAVPFRVICLIGMNEGAFPRRDRSSPFDSEQDRRLEPSVRDEDRYLFLQQLMAARDELHLSWVGEDARDGSRMEPSAVVSELLGILPQYGVEAKTCVVEHPLQPFSPRLFDGSDAALFSYDAGWLAATSASPAVRRQRFVEGATAATIAAPLRLDWREWLRFWRNPAAAYFTGALGIELPRAPESDGDEDDLVLSGLGRYIAFNELLDLYDKAGPSAQRELLRAQGALPAGAAGEQAFADLQAPLAELGAARAMLIGAAEPERGEPFELDFDELVLSGTLPAHRNGVLVHAQLKPAEGNRLLQAWLDYLLLATQRADARLILLEWDAKNSVATRRAARGISPEQARAWLADLARLHARGSNTPLPYFPKASHAYAVAFDNGEASAEEIARHADALKSAAKAYASSEHPHGRYRGDDAEPAFALAVRGIPLFDARSPESRAFADCALSVFGPPRRTLQAVDVETGETPAAKTRSAPRAKGARK